MAKTPEATTELQVETLRGDVRDAVLSEFKASLDAWPKLSEQQQERLIRRADDIADKLVRCAVDIVAARGLPALAITVGKFTVDGADVKGTFNAYAGDEELLRIRHLSGARAMFVLASPDAFDGERKPAEPDNVGDLGMPKGEPERSADERQDEPQLETVGRGKKPKANGGDRRRERAGAPA